MHFILTALLFLAATPTNHKVVLTWTLSTDAGASYEIARSSGACPTSLPAPPIPYPLAGFTQVGTAAAGVATFTDTGMPAGTYCYYAVATLNGATSVPSNMVTPQVLPGTVVITVTVAQ